MEGVNPRLMGTELGPTLLERGGGFVVDRRDDRGTVDEGDCRESLVGDRQIPRRGREGEPLIGGRASWETTGSGGRSFGVADEGMIDVVHGGVGRAGVLAGLGRRV